MQFPCIGGTKTWVPIIDLIFWIYLTFEKIIQWNIPHSLFARFCTRWNDFQFFESVCKWINKTQWASKKGNKLKKLMTRYKWDCYVKVRSLFASHFLFKMGILLILIIYVLHHLEQLKQIYLQVVLSWHNTIFKMTQMSNYKP